MQRKFFPIQLRPYLAALSSSLALFWLVDIEVHAIVGMAVYAAFLFLYSSPRFLDYRAGKSEKAVGALLTLLLITAEGWPDRLLDAFSIKAALLFCVALYCLYSLFRNLLVCLYASIQAHVYAGELDRPMRNGRRVFALSFLLLWVTYFVFFLNQYPGVLDCDTPTQMAQALGRTHFENANPLINTLFVTLFVRIGSALFRNINGGLALYTVFQLTFAAGVFAYTVSVIWQKGYSKGAVAASHLFFNAVPYNIAFAIGMWKDTFFALFFLWTIVRLWVLLDRESNRRDLIGVFLLVLVTSLARNSGWSALLLCAAAMYLLGQKNEKKLSGAIAGGVAACLVIMGVVYPLCGVSNHNNAAMGMSIPLQQVSRVIAVGGDIPQEDMERISDVIDPDYVRENYDEKISDPMKKAVDGEKIQQHWLEYAGLWVRLGLYNPRVYYDAYIGLMKGYWDLEYRTWLWDGSIFENSYGILRTPVLFPQWDMDQTLKSLSYRYGDSLKSYVFLRAPFVLWSLLICMGYALSRKKTQDLLLYIPILGIFGGLLLSSPVALFRYTYCAAVCLPVIYCLPFRRQRRKEHEP